MRGQHIMHHYAYMENTDQVLLLHTFRTMKIGATIHSFSLWIYSNNKHYKCYKNKDVLHLILSLITYKTCPGMRVPIYVHNRHRSLFEIACEIAERERLETKTFRDMCLASRMSRWVLARDRLNDKKLSNVK
jgi:hypothetical protein